MLLKYGMHIANTDETAEKKKLRAEILEAGHLLRNKVDLNLFDLIEFVSKNIKNAELLKTGRVSSATGSYALKRFEINQRNGKPVFDFSASFYYNDKAGDPADVTALNGLLEGIDVEPDEDSTSTCASGAVIRCQLDKWPYLVPAIVYVCLSVYDEYELGGQTSQERATSNLEMLLDYFHPGVSHTYLLHAWDFEMLPDDMDKFGTWFRNHAQQPSVASIALPEADY